MDLPENKLYWSTKELSEYAGVPASTIRFWQEEFVGFIKPLVTISGRYQYSREDVKTVMLVKHLLKDKKYTLDGAKEYLRKSKSKSLSNKEMLDTLLDVRKKLYDIRAELNEIKDQE